MLLALTLACSKDPADGAGDTGDTSGSLPLGPGDFRVSALGVTYDLALAAPIELTDDPIGHLSAAGATGSPLTATLAIAVFDDVPIDEGSYELGQWGGAANQTEIALVVFVDGVTHELATNGLTTTPGSLTIDELDRTSQRVSLSFVGELEHTADGEPQGAETVSGALVEQLYTVP
jgi:hypothetical protein